MLCTHMYTYLSCWQSVFDLSWSSTALFFQEPCPHKNLVARGGITTLATPTKYESACVCELYADCMHYSLLCATLPQIFMPPFISEVRDIIFDPLESLMPICRLFWVYLSYRNPPLTFHWNTFKSSGSKVSIAEFLLTYFILSLINFYVYIIICNQ